MPVISWLAYLILYWQSDVNSGAAFNVCFGFLYPNLPGICAGARLWNCGRERVLPDPPRGLIFGNTAVAYSRGQARRSANSSRPAWLFLRNVQSPGIERGGHGDGVCPGQSHTLV